MSAQPRLITNQNPASLTVACRKRFDFFRTERHWKITGNGFFASNRQKRIALAVDADCEDGYYRFKNFATASVRVRTCNFS